MRLFRRSQGADDQSELEARLRAERPEPSVDFVERLAGGVPGRRPAEPSPRYRLQLAGGATAILVAAVAALGGLASPVTAVDDLVFDRTADVAASQDQYLERLTICHRPPGVTLTLPEDAALAHLRNHPGDTLGACPAGTRRR
jgi:hypothetical protein